MASVGYVSKKTFLHRLDARCKLILMLAVLVVVLVLSHPLYVLAVLGVVLAAWLMAGLPFDMVRDIFKYFSGIAILIFVLQAFFYPGETNWIHISGPAPVIGFSGYITLEGVLYGVAMVLRLVVIMIVAPLLVMTTSLSDLMLALVKFKIPYRFAFILTTAMSLFPAIQGRADLIQQAQLCRGVADFESKNFFVKLKASGSLLIPLILGEFRDSQILEVAMSSRGFGAPIKRTFLLESKYQWQDYVFTALSVLLVAGVVTLRILHLGAI